MSQAGSNNEQGQPGVVELLEGNTGGPVGPNGSNIIFVVGSGETTVAGNPGTNTLTISSNDLHVAKLIVNPTPGAGGNYTTITLAMAAAVSGDTIFIMSQPTPYVENFTLKPGVNLVAFDADADTGNVTIQGEITISAAGTYSISGILLQTNGALCLNVTGANVLKVFLTDCQILASNNQAISINNSNAAVLFFQCDTTSLATHKLFDISNTSGVAFQNCRLNAADGTQSRISAAVVGGAVQFDNSIIASSILTSGGGNAILNNCRLFPFTNSNFLTTSGTGTTYIYNCSISSGTATAVSIGAGTTVYIADVSITSSNVNAIGGSGTLYYGPVTFAGASSTIQNTVTANALPVIPGGVSGPASSTNTGIATWNGTGGTALNSPPTPLVTSGGIMTNSNQPCFAAHLGADVTNVTGDGTAYQVIFDQSDFDQNSNYNAGTGAFTAPVTGKYAFSASCFTSNIGTSEGFGISIVTTAKTVGRSFDYNGAGNANSQTISSGPMAMTAGDTCHIAATNKYGAKNNTISNTSDITGTNATFFSGYLIC